MAFCHDDSDRVTLVRKFDRTLAMETQDKDEKIISWASGLGYAGEQ